jgi:two-component system, cell cycle sensor histidine kinase and response regulator CckA
VIQVSTGTQLFNEGELTVAFPSHHLHGGTYVFIEVVDTGCGMDEGTIAKIFDPFFTTKFTGRGLGLAAVQGIIRGHHGALHVRSEPGRGATFRVLFPAVESQIVDATLPKAVSADAEWRLEGCVLVVDDEPAVRALACQILEQAGVTVLSAVDGWDAVRQFEAHSTKIDAVLLDLTMPGLDGGEVFQRLVRTNPAVKVILCSGYDTSDANSKCSPHRAAGFLRKPYSPNELINSFQSILHLHKRKP